MPKTLIQPTDRGLWVEAGGFFIDPWEPVDRAVVTHAHADHCRWGCERYLCSAEGEPVLRQRVQPDARVEAVGFGEPVTVGDAKVTLYPAGHLLGSAQVLVEVGGRREVSSGDYKLEPDPTCTPWEAVACDRYITESTFGLPIYRWPDQDAVAADMIGWWRENQAAGRTSVIFGYALGKSQRVLNMMLEAVGGDPADLPGEIVAHGAVRKFVEVYRQVGRAVPPVLPSTPDTRKRVKGTGLVIAPPSTLGTTWLKRFAPFGTAFASGWMMVRGNRRRRGVDRGFVVSDHVDWPGLHAALDATGCDEVGVTHGYVEQVVRHLREHGVTAEVVPTHFEAREDDAGSVEEQGESEA